MTKKKSDFKILININFYNLFFYKNSFIDTNLNLTLFKY